MENRDLQARIRSAFERPNPPSDPGFQKDSEFAEVCEGIWGKSWSEISYEKFDYENLIFAFIPQVHFSYFFGYALQICIKKSFRGPESLNIFFGRWSDFDGIDIEMELTGQLNEMCQRYSGNFDSEQKCVLKEFVRARGKALSDQDNKAATNFISAVCAD